MDLSRSEALASPLCHSCAAHISLQETIAEGTVHSRPPAATPSELPQHPHRGSPSQQLTAGPGPEPGHFCPVQDSSNVAGDSPSAWPRLSYWCPEVGVLLPSCPHLAGVRTALWSEGLCPHLLLPPSSFTAVIPSIFQTPLISTSQRTQTDPISSSDHPRTLFPSMEP